MSNQTNLNEIHQSSEFILLATNREWRNVASKFLQQKGFTILIASSQEEALFIIQSQKLSGVVMISDWAVTNDDSNVPGLMEAVKGKFPTVTLIT